MEAVTAIDYVGRFWQNVIFYLEQEISNLIHLHAIQVNTETPQVMSIGSSSILASVSHWRGYSELSTLCPGNLLQIVKNKPVEGVRSSRRAFFNHGIDHIGALDFRRA